MTIDGHNRGEEQIFFPPSVHKVIAAIFTLLLCVFCLGAKSVMSDDPGLPVCRFNYRQASDSRRPKTDQGKVSGRPGTLLLINNMRVADATRCRHPIIVAQCCPNQTEMRKLSRNPEAPTRGEKTESRDFVFSSFHLISQNQKENFTLFALITNPLSLGHLFPLSPLGSPRR